MTQSAILQQSTFSSGEVSPALYGRVDLQRYTSALRLLKNMFVKAEGGVSKRPGTRFVAPTKDGQTVNLVPFQPTSTDGYMIEFGDQYARFHINGGMVLDDSSAETTTDITNGTPNAVFDATSHSLVNGDQVVITDNDGVNLLKGRFCEVANAGADDFELIDWETGDPVLYDATMSGATITVKKPYEIETPYLAADVADLSYAQSVDVLYIAHRSYPQYKLSRTAVTPTFTLEQIYFNSRRLSTPTAPVVGTWVYEASGLAGTLPNGTSMEAYVITTVDRSDDSFATESLPSAEFTATRDTNWADTAGASVQIVLPAIGTGCDANSTHARIYKRVGGAFLFIGEEKLSSSGTIGFRDRNLNPSVSAASPPKENDFFGRVIAYGSGTAGVGGVGPVLGNIVVFSPSNATARVINEGDGDETAGSMTVTPLTGTITTSDTISDWGSSVPGTPPSVDSIVNNYPGTVTFFEDRLTWGGSAIAPQTVWTSQSGDYENVTVSASIVASDAVEFTINSRQLNDIHSMVALSDLILMTSGAVWSASGAGDNEPIAPDSIKVRVQSYAGAEDMPPVVLDDSVLFIESKSQSVRDLNYEFTVDRYTGNDLSVMSRHLVEDYDMIDWCAQKVPHGLIWIVRDDGKVLSLTYLKEHDVRGWAQHEFGDGVVSIGSVSGVEKDDVYMVVDRGTRRHIEFLEDRRYGSDIKDAWFVDDGLSPAFSGKNVWGLWHLEGETLSALVDGDVEENLVVSNGGVTLTNAATSKVIIGKPFTGEVTTLDLNVDAQGGALHAQRRRISKIFVRVFDTRGLFAAEDGSSPLNELKQRKLVYDNAFSAADTEGVFEIVPAADWSRNGRVHLEFPYPLPAEVTSIMPQMTVGG